ncbi:MAG: hypothetical protein Q9171_002418 [Xanthocarpia ochracea]
MELQHSGETVGTTKVYAPTTPIAPKGEATESTIGKVKDEESDNGDADILPATAVEALAGGSEEEALEDEDKEEAAAE